MVSIPLSSCSTPLLILSQFVAPMYLIIPILQYMYVNTQLFWPHETLVTDRRLDQDMLVLSPFSFSSARHYGHLPPKTSARRILMNSK